MSDLQQQDFRQELYARYVSTFKAENAEDASSAHEREHYYRWCDARYASHLQSLRKDAAIVELGCGHGRMLGYLQSRGFANVRGVDVSQEQVDIARRQGLNAACDDIFHVLETESGALDAVIAIDLVEHLTKEELLRLFVLLHDRLRAGGIVLIQTANGEGLFPRQIMYGDLTHMTIFTPGSLTQLLHATGFGEVKCAEAEPLYTGATGFVRKLAWRCITAGANAIRTIETGKRQKIWTENFIASARRL